MWGRLLGVQRLGVISGLWVCGVLCGFGVQAWAANLPDYYQEPGFNHFREVKLGQFGESIDPFNGGLQLHLTPIMLPGNGGLDIEIQLTYRSISKQGTQIGDDHKSWASPFGVGWDLHMGRIWPGSNDCPGKGSGGLLDADDQVAPVLELADGSRRSLLAYSGTAGFDLITQDRWAAKCDDANNQYIVYSPDGVRYFFPKVGHAIAPGSDRAYSVSKIADANGNTILVEYLTNDRHQLVNRVYFLGQRDDGVQLTYEAKGDFYYLQSIVAMKSSDSVRKSWAFTYTPVKQVALGHYFLTQINPPEINTWKFDYYYYVK
jgi:hypothetical protein